MCTVNMKFKVKYKYCPYVAYVSEYHVDKHVDKEFRNLTFTLVSYSLDKVIDYNGETVDTLPELLLELIEERILDEHIKTTF